MGQQRRYPDSDASLGGIRNKWQGSNELFLTCAQMRSRRCESFRIFEGRRFWFSESEVDREHVAHRWLTERIDFRLSIVYSGEPMHVQANFLKPSLKNSMAWLLGGVRSAIC